MAFYAVVVVLEQPDGESAYRQITRSTDGVVFVGEPWEVKPLEPVDASGIEPYDNPEFDTTYCLLQRCTL
jgi:hypothetical protein